MRAVFEVRSLRCASFRESLDLPCVTHAQHVFLELPLCFPSRAAIAPSRWYMYHISQEIVPNPRVLTNHVLLEVWE